MVDRDNQQGSERYIRDTHRVPNFSGPLMLPNRASANSLSAPMRSSTGYNSSVHFTLHDSHLVWLNYFLCPLSWKNCSSSSSCFFMFTMN